MSHKDTSLLSWSRHNYNCDKSIEKGYEKSPWNSIHEIVFNMTYCPKLLTYGNRLIPKAEGKTHVKEKQCSERTTVTFAPCIPLQWQSGQHRRTPVREKIWARPFLIKGPLIAGWTASRSHVLSSEVSASFLTGAHRSGAYPGKGAVYVISTVEGPISRKTLWEATGGKAVVWPSQLGSWLYLLGNFYKLRC